MKVKEVADISGVSVRTLHHYDEIGLLKPQEVTESGYRIYSDQNLEILQQILFFRELGLPLKKIKEIITDPAFDREEALRTHRRMLLEKRKRLDEMLGTIDKTLQHIKGAAQMSNQEKFKGFDFSHNPYEQEARECWGDKAVNQSKGKIAGMDQEELGNEMNAIYWKLSSLRTGSPGSDEAQEAIKEWFDFLNRIGSYSLDAFKGLGQMYIADPRFTKNIDQFGDGLAEFMCEAMSIFADKGK